MNQPRRPRRPAQAVGPETSTGREIPAPQAPAADLGLDGFRHPLEEGLSLEQLTAAFQQLLSTGEEPYAPAADPEAPLAPEPAQAAQAGTADPTVDDRCEVTPRSILEALLFVGHPQNEPLTADRVAQWMRGVSPAEVEQLVDELNQLYTADERPYEIVPDGAGYRLALRGEMARLRDQFFGRQRQARLSQAAVEVLSIVAYHQPVTAEQVAARRGRPSGPLLTQLVRRQLLSLERSGTRPPVVTYCTTRRFLTLFGLASLDELPRGVDLDQR